LLVWPRDRRRAAAAGRERRFTGDLSARAFALRPRPRPIDHAVGVRSLAPETNMSET
jgi:hypothetical protein